MTRDLQVTRNSRILCYGVVYLVIRLSLSCVVLYIRPFVIAVEGRKEEELGLRRGITNIAGQQKTIFRSQA